MNDNSLTSLYRRMTAVTPLSVADADAVTAATPREAAASLAGSARLADLRRLLDALRPASETLACAVHDTAISDVLQPGHRHGVRRAAASRHARRGSRPLRWVASIAAGLVVALWATSQREAVMPNAGIAKSGIAIGKDGDRIFTSEDRIFAATDGYRPTTTLPRDQRDGDRVFRGNFSGG